MDSNIRLLLASVQQYGVLHGENSALHQAYELLKTVADSRPNTDGPEAFGHDLYVLCAEIAFQNGFPDMTKDCLRMYFMKTPPPNQFLCRAYLCQSQLQAPSSAENPSQLEKAVVYLLKAISFAKENTRYHFLVYNASVLYWQFCRPFLKSNYRQYLSISLHQVVKALDDIDDKDYEWRAQLMIALIECHVDAGRMKEAAEVSKATAEFTKSHIPVLFKQVLRLQVRHHLVDQNKVAKELRNNPDLTALHKILKVKATLEQRDSGVDIHNELEKVLKHILRDDSGSRASSSMSVQSAGRRTTTPSGPTMQPVSQDEKPVLLLELARLCNEYEQPDLTSVCIENMKQCTYKDTGVMLEMEFLEAELTVKNLGEKQEFYTKSAFDVRIQALKRLEEAIQNGVRHGDPNIIQAGCVTHWNLCLPLLQPNLRQYIRKTLTIVAESMEKIDSLLILLRCQIHTELAKCEEDEEQISVAMDHLKKAIYLDDGGQYRERLEGSLHRLKLRAELYQQPESPIDQAVMIIEQARTSAESGTILMKRALLMRAGQALSPDAFLLVLDSESESFKEGAGGRGVQTQISKLGAKAKHFQKMLSKTDGHLIRLGNENDRDRARLWADLAKTARKQEVWDVCRVASRFCLLYDDIRWNIPKPTGTPRVDVVSQSSNLQDGETVATPSPGKKREAPAQPPIEPGVPHSDRDLVRLLAEIHFLNAEAQIHLLRSEGIQLNDKPIPPVDKSKHPKGYVPKKPEDDPDWILYCEWIQSLSDNTTKGFLRAAELGIELNEPWIVCSAAAYVWNYNNHVLTQNRHREIISPLATLLEALKVVGHAGETVLLVQLCTALAYGYIKPWIPEAPSRDSVVSPTKGASTDKVASPKKPKSIPSPKSKIQSLSVDQQGMDDIKKAVEVCEYGIDVTNGTRVMDIIPIDVRHPLLQIWVHSKQLLGQQIHRSLGCEDDVNGQGQRPMTRCLVTSEMLSVNGKGLNDFKEGPPLAETVNMVDTCQWSDPLVELQIWTRLADLAFSARNHNIVMKCSGKALEFDVDNNNAAPKLKKIDSFKYMVQQEMLSYASCIMGQSLMDNMQGKNVVRRSALEAFVNAARYGRRADNYQLVITAARHYWNSALPLVSEPIERQLLRQPLTVILECITATVERSKKEEKKKTENGSESGDAVRSVPPSVPASSLGSMSPLSQAFGDPESDLTLRAAMYGVLFQSYADKGDFEQGLAAMDKAVNDMPRTKHRLLIFKHRVMVKAKLGRNLHMDIAKFKDESEDYVAHMWRKVALCSKDQLEQLTSYQMAIEALQSSASEWQKVDYLLEFAEWLYINEFPLEDSLDQVEWAVDVLLNMKMEVSKPGGSGM